MDVKTQERLCFLFIHISRQELCTRIHGLKTPTTTAGIDDEDDDDDDDDEDVGSETCLVVYDPRCATKMAE
jgi:hypothetical protein